ncbi:hypothetical protein EYF80_067275 [Liparis tanakae]|uniref:Uncharacterized protein n=1 Tax=Liparis tanakae TaxID=230148 RepID=A0A4Z2E1G9_9TELE|nr:hypothetical protein EYF80_067275 [Liparis tanakae]
MQSDVIVSHLGQHLQPESWSVGPAHWAELWSVGPAHWAELWSVGPAHWAELWSVGPAHWAELWCSYAVVALEERKRRRGRGEEEEEKRNPTNIHTRPPPCLLSAHLSRVLCSARSPSR